MRGWRGRKVRVKECAVAEEVYEGPDCLVFLVVFLRGIQFLLFLFVCSVSLVLVSVPSGVSLCAGQKFGPQRGPRAETTEKTKKKKERRRAAAPLDRRVAAQKNKKLLAGTPEES